MAVAIIDVVILRAETVRFDSIGKRKLRRSTYMTSRLTDFAVNANLNFKSIVVKFLREKKNH